MTPKERMLIAIDGGTPDRLPITIHQWQGYHLRNHMNGMTQLEAFKATGLDAAIAPRGILSLRQSPDWTVTCQDVTQPSGQPRTRIRIETPDAFVEHARTRDVHPATLAVCWVMNHPAVTAPIIGARNLEQLEPSLAAADLVMSDAWRREISSLSIEPPPATDRLEEKR